MSGDLDSLKPLLSPTSIAVIGASDDPTRIGGRPIRYLLNAGFKGEIFPVNPNRTTVQGVKAYAAIGDVGRPVDNAILIIPAEAAVETIRDCGKAGVKSAIVLSAGFAEVGAEGEARQNEMVAVARAYGIRLLGPNTNGAVNNLIGAYQTFSMATEKPDRPGRVGMVSQSGGYASYFLHLARAQGLDFAQWLATGNECDVEIGEVMNYLAEDPNIDVVMGYAEGIRNPDSFIGALEAAQRNGKPVVFLKVGSSDVGAKAAASHTAALAGSDKIYDAVFREFGVLRAKSAEEFLAIGYAASHRKFPKSRQVVVLTTSGGLGVHTSDYLRERDMDIPVLKPETQQALLKISPHGSPTNPVDTTGQVVNEPAMLTRMTSEILDREDSEVVLTLLAHSATSPLLAQRLLDAVKELPARYPSAVLAIALVTTDEVRQALRNHGFMVFDDPVRAVPALAALAAYGTRAGQPPVVRATVSRPSAAMNLAGNLNEESAKTQLSERGIPVPRRRTVAGSMQAADAATQIGFPVVLKILSADIAHKSDIGGVVVGLNDAMAVQTAADRMAQTVTRLRPDARIDGFLVEEMVSGGVECVLGFVRDPVFGPAVMFGLGGVSVEIFQDITFRLAPVTRVEASRMVREIKGLPLLLGHRGNDPSDIEALTDAITAFSEIGAASGPRLRSFEINPLLVRSTGKGVVALDAAVEAD